MLFVQLSADDRSDRMDNVSARQIIGRRDFCLTCRLVMPLLVHYLVAVTPELDPRKGMYRIINTAVTGIETAEHL